MMRSSMPVMSFPRKRSFSVMAPMRWPMSMPALEVRNHSLSKPAQVSYAEAVESTLNQTANMLAEKDSNLTCEHAYARAIALYSHMVGSVLLSRAISASRPALADKILKDAQASIFASLPPGSDRDSHHRAKARP